LELHNKIINNFFSKIMKKNIFALLFVVALLAPMLSLAVSGSAYDQLPTDMDVIINNIENVLFDILIAAAVIVMLVAGFFFLTAAGDPAKFKTAQMMVLYAVIGVIVAISAKAIVYFVQDVIGGSTSPTSNSQPNPNSPVDVGNEMNN
jgi:hypothetical protein